MSDDRHRFGAVGDTPIDRAIDRAVREIMRVDPPAGLRRRVLSRIEAPPRRSIFLPRVAVAAAALAILVVAGLVMRREPAAPPSRPGTTVAVETPAQIEPRPAPAPGPLIAAPPRPVSSRPSGRTVEAIRMPRIGNVFGAATGQLSATTVADAPAPGEIPDASGQRSPELLGPAPPIVIREITIVPLEVEQLRVPPIGPPR